MRVNPVTKAIVNTPLTDVRFPIFKTDLFYSLLNAYIQLGIDESKIFAGKAYIISHRRKRSEFTATGINRLIFLLAIPMPLEISMEAILL